MKILILSFYYAPDLSAGSFRTRALVAALAAAAPDAHIEVLTALPNRYSTFAVEAAASEVQGNVHVRRFALPGHASGMIDQSLAFLAFARQVLRNTAEGHYDLVYATSSRLLTAVLGALVARRTCAPLYLDIRDLFVDTIKDVLPARFAWLARPVFAWLERRTMRQARRINLVSRGFAPYFAARYPDRPLSFFTNGIDDEFIAISARQRGPRADAILTVVYAGNLGEGQGLHQIVPALALGLQGRARLRIIGDGGRRAALLEAVRDCGADNVTWEPPMQRDALLRAYHDADVLFLHLNDHAAFEKVLPSKLFEYAATGKPILAGVAGYAAEFIRAEIRNAVVFPPCDAVEASRVFAGLDLRDTPRPEFVAKFARRGIMESMAAEVLSLARTAADPEVKGWALPSH